jgi:hypothetical protein
MASGVPLLRDGEYPAYSKRLIIDNSIYVTLLEYVPIVGTAVVRTYVSPLLLNSTLRRMIHTSQL